MESVLVATTVFPGRGGETALCAVGLNCFLTYGLLLLLLAIVVVDRTSMIC